MGLSFMEKAKIENIVGELLAQNGYSFGEDTSVDIVELARKLGFVVGIAELPDNEDGFLAIQPLDPEKRDGEGGGKIIGVNVSRPIDLKRFIIAHEFAHWALHYQEGKVFLHRENKKGKSIEENDADYFAAALLMPRASFSRVYSQLKEKGLNDVVICAQLAATFKTPLESVTRRIEEIAAFEAM